MRLDYGASVLADLAIHSIHLERQERAAESEGSGEGIHFKPIRVCHIIDSIKNQEELKILRMVYRDMLYCIGVLSPVELRVTYLRGRSLKDPDIYQLIDRDSGEEMDHGQRVRDTFPQSDFFLRIGSRDHKEIDLRLERFLQVMLGTDIATPTVEEQAMYLAATASLNSACLSRQVGAAVTDPQGNVLGVGWNDVPRPGGGFYITNVSPDRRCINIDGGVCQNDLRKGMLREEIVRALGEEHKLLKDGVIDQAHAALKDSKIRDLLEFCRSIHAEMHAIITAAQKTGNKMIGGTLFCTTYPCHSCARHIVVSGIKTIFYIEPYRKSLALELHEDAISESESDTKKVRILPFDGVAPNRYMELFRMAPDSRKKEGRKWVSTPRDAMHKSGVSLEPFPYLEGAVVKSLVDRELVNVSGKPLKGAKDADASKQNKSDVIKPFPKAEAP
jgi:deoxycytidylate deaminase